MKKALLSMLLVCLLASASFAMVDSIYAVGGKVGVGLMDSMLGIETSLSDYNSSTIQDFSLAARILLPVAKHGKSVTSLLGVLASSTSTNNAAAALGVSLLYTVEYKVTDALALFGDVTLVGISDTSNSNSIQALNSTLIGGRLYL